MARDVVHHDAEDEVEGILHYGRELCVSVDWRAAREPDLFD